MRELGAFLLFVLGLATLALVPVMIVAALTDWPIEVTARGGAVGWGIFGLAAVGLLSIRQSRKLIGIGFISGLRQFASFIDELDKPDHE